MSNWLQTKLLESWIQAARQCAMSHLGRKTGDEVDGTALLFLDMFLWCTVFYATDNRFGTSPLNRREERAELVLLSIKRIMKRFQKRPLSKDELLEWSQIVGLFMGHFDRYITSMGGTLALCKPVFSLCIRALISNETMRRLFPTDEHIRAFDLAAAHGAVYLLNVGGRLSAYKVADQEAEGLDLNAPDAFVSYASKDREIAIAIAESLNHLRIPTWIDRNLPATSNFARTIDARIQTANVVIVLWSNASVESKWVQAEALYGFNMGRLVGIMIEPCVLPVPFNAVQAIEWPPSPTPPVEKWTQLLGAIGPRLNRDGLSEYVSASLDPVKLAGWRSRFPHDPLAQTHSTR